MTHTLPVNMVPFNKDDKNLKSVWMERLWCSAVYNRVSG